MWRFWRRFCEELGFWYKETSAKTGFLEIRYEQKIDRTIFGNFETNDQTKQEIYANIENLRKCSFYRYLIYVFNIQCYLRNLNRFLWSTKKV